MGERLGSLAAQHSLRSPASCLLVLHSEFFKSFIVKKKKKKAALHSPFPPN